jgi:hypothetical protein
MICTSVSARPPRAAATNSGGQTTRYRYDAGYRYLLSGTPYLSATDAVGHTTSYSYSRSANPALVHPLTSATNLDGTQQLFS